MCKAIDFANGINQQITEAKEYYDNLQIKQSVFDGVEQDILHKIEDLDKFSLYTGWKFCMSLSKLRKARRKTKNELQTMALLIQQLGAVSIKETTINNKANGLENLTNNKVYHERQLKITEDILVEVDDIVNNIVYNKKLEKEQAINDFNGNKIYEMSEKIPKVKGSNVRIAFKTQAQKQHLIKNNKPKYESYYENNTEKYIEFIGRKTDK